MSPNSDGPAPVPGKDVGPGSLHWRLASLASLLDRAGVAHSGVRAVGPDAEIAVVDAPVTEVAALATLSREIRLLGFRFTTVDLGRVPGPSVFPSLEAAP